MPIIKSLLDTDFYKFTMDQFILSYYPKTTTEFSFKCRTPDVPLTKLIDIGRLREELDHVRSLTFRTNEVEYIASIKADDQHVFTPDFLHFLPQVRLPEYNLEIVDSTYRIEFEGLWQHTTWWETFSLSIVNELYADAIRKREQLDPSHYMKEGLARLEEKKRQLRHCPYLKYCDFGTRRRYERLWQEIVVENLATTMPKQFVGTSNVLLAKEYNLSPTGTMAHELDMGLQGEVHLHEDFDEMVSIHNRVMDKWEEMYGYGLRVNLPDTFGSEWALGTMSYDRMKNWIGERHDSGHPFWFADQRIERWKSHGIDPREKVIVFSDGLEVDRIVRLYLCYADKVKPLFGWGTNLTNDVGIKPISIVVKLTKSNGFPTVKLSDNLCKSTGPPEMIERFKKQFGYVENLHEECTY